VTAAKLVRLAIAEEMAYLNENYLKLEAGYLFPEVARRVREFCEANPEAAKRLIRCGIGDVTEPLPPATIDAMKQAVDEMGKRETFRGYGPEQGYEFLRSAIAQHDYRDRNIEMADDEIFVSDGSKCDCGYILDILGDQNKVAVPDPVYPVYVDTNVMAGHSGPAKSDGSYAGIVTCRAPFRTDSFPNRRENTSISFTFVFRITPLEQSHLANSSHVGSITRGSTRRSCFLTPRMKHMSRSQIFRVRSSRFRERANARWNCAVFPRMAVSRAYAVDLQSCQNRCSRERSQEKECRSIRSGIAAGARRRTA